MLTILWWYWLIGVCFTCFVLYIADNSGAMMVEYNDYMKENEKTPELIVSYKTFELAMWICSFIILPLIYPATIIYALKDR